VQSALQKDLSEIAVQAARSSSSAALCRMLTGRLQHSKIHSVMIRF
jgi:hypothetical protein